MMENKIFFFSTLIIISCILLSVITLSTAVDDVSSANPISPSTICKSTPYPTFCKSLLTPNSNSSSNAYDYGLFSVRKSLSAAQKFLSLINEYLRKSRNLTITAIRALEDCKFLAELNIDYLMDSFVTVNGTWKKTKTLPVFEADDVQTLLSGILTNTQTCVDGLQTTASAWSVRNGILSPLTNDTRLFSVSLALFTKAWVPKRKKRPSSSRGKQHLTFQNGRLNFKMSAKNQKMLNTVANRRLLQTDDNNADDDNKVLVSDTVVVNQNGTGNFTTVNDAVAAAPVNSNGTNGYFLIYITAGVYEEYVSIAKNKKYLMMLGDGINQTIITGNHSFVDGWTTFNSSTFAVVGAGIVAMNITFRNTAGAIKHQAVAVRNGADLSTFYSCSFEAYQDTLYVHSLRQFYRDCDVYGTVDFIFGNAAAVFQNCNLYPRLPMANQFNAITAQGRTDPNQNTGISIHDCTIRPADDLLNSTNTIRTYLGRPWKDYSRTIYMQSYMDGFINPSGWREWSGDFALNTSYYGEFNNTGEGSNTSGRVNWPGFHLLNSSDAAGFTVSTFLLRDQSDTWILNTGVPYQSGLL